MAPEHGPVVGQGHRLRRKAPVQPLQKILLLRRGGGTVPQLQRTHIRGHPLLALGVLAQVGGGPLLGVQSPAGPGVALLLDLAHGGPAAGAVLAGGALGAVAHQQEDHVRRQAQIVVKAQQHGKVRGGQALAQLPLHLRRQRPEDAVLFKALGDVLALVGGRLLGGLGLTLRLGRAQQLHLPELVLRRGGALSVPVELLGRLGRGDGPPAAQQADVQKGRVPVPLRQQAAGHRAGQRDALVLRQTQKAASHLRRLLSCSFSGLFGQRPDSVLFYTIVPKRTTRNLFPRSPSSLLRGQKETTPVRDGLAASLTLGGRAAHQRK